MAAAPQDGVIVVGAGMGGLAAALRLAAAGCSVTVVEAAPAPGGKARARPSAAGPVDAGPTVLTLRAVFDDLFALAGQRLDDHVTLVPQELLARHWWPDGASLDLTPDPQANARAIARLAGARDGRAFARFDRLAAALFAAFDGPVMQSARPDLPAIARAALRSPRLWPALLPGMTLDRLLRLTFRDPRLIQLFGRYATYVGGRPTHVPAVLALVWRAEAAGVWAVRGGMHRLAEALATAAAGLGVRFRYGTRVARILRQGGRVTGVQLAGGETLACAACVWNGDPGALAAGLAGEAGAAALPPGAAAPRSLSAHVWAFAARPQGPRAAELAHHNVFFTDDPAAEFGPIGQGRAPERPTLYLCAEDRLTGPGPPPGAGPERFEIILNAPAGLPPTADEAETCRRKTFDRLRRLGLWFDPEPGPACLTTPATLAQDFPGSQGAIYGRSPEGMLAAFRRPPAQTRLPGLILAGGGAHPGAGVPMAALSGRFAAEATLRALTSPKASARTATPGGISTGSATTGRAPSR